MSQLRAEQIVMNFGALRAVDHVSLTLERGEMLGLIGPNGSGKTTTVNIITGFLKPTDGRVMVDDTDVTGWTPDRIASVKVRRTFQTIRLFKALTVLENVTVAAVSAGESMRKARHASEEILKRLDLAWLANTSAGTLPYGQERRVEIARALVTRPNYLLLDEPAAGLNENESDDLLTTLPAIVRDFGCGMLIIDHDMRLIMRLCDKLHVLNYGKTIGTGTPAEVRKNPDVIKAYLGGERAS